MLLKKRRERSQALSVRKQLGGFRKIAPAIVAVFTLIGLMASVTTPVALAATSSDNQAPDQSASEQNQVPQKSPAEMKAYAIEFRQKFGLAYDDATLGAAGTAPNPACAAKYGLPLTAAECTEQSARDQRADAAGPLVTAVAQHADELAGLWIDQLNGGAFAVMALPSASAVTRASVVAAAPAGATVRFDPAQFSGAVLDAASRLISAVLVDSTAPGGAQSGNPIVELKQKGFTVTGSGTDFQANRIKVGVEKLPGGRVGELNDAWDAAASRGALPARELVVLVESGPNQATATRSDSPGPMQGGLEIHGTPPGTSNDYRCTSNLAASGGIQMTASHCYSPGTPVTHFGMSIGTAGAYDGWFNGSTSDVIGMQLPLGGLVSPYIFSAYGCGAYDNTCQQIDQAGSVRNPVSQGDRACTSGDTTYRVICGSVSIPSYTGSISSWRGVVTFQDQAIVNVLIQPGDSGGVVGNGSVIFGINSAANQYFGTIFSKMSNALAAMGRSLVTTRGWGLVQSAYSLRCADVQWNSSANGTPVWGWGCNGNAAQQWTFTPWGTGHVCCHIPWQLKRAALSTKCFDMDIAIGAPNGAKVQEWDCLSTDSRGQANQLWEPLRVGGYDRRNFYLKSWGNGRYLDKDLNTGGDGEKLQVWDYNGQLQQQFRLA